MARTPERRSWVLMSAEAALGRQEAISNLSKEYDLIIVPAQYMQQVIEILDALPPSDGQ